MTKGTVADSYRNQELLARAWHLSHEHGRAIAAMISALNQSPNGNGFSFLTDLYMEADLYSAAIESANQGLQLGKLKSPGRLHLNKGIALLFLKQFDAAYTSFQAATKDKSTVELANKWLLQCEIEQNRYEQLNLVLASD
jgi:tetratricopeptide (TPR) repeat protein